MRRMTTTKQLNYIKDLSEVAEKGFKVGTYPAEIYIYGGAELDLATLMDEVNDGSVDFENHTFEAGLSFHLPELLKKYGLGSDGYAGYIYIMPDNTMTMPDSVVDFNSLVE